MMRRGDCEVEKDRLLLSRLKKYGESKAYPFHMPGHKRMAGDKALNGFPNPFAVDITEIEGFDNLHHPEGILKESMEWAASVYGADRTYYLVNGSSCGILSAICAATEHGGTILMSRNCHKSAYHGVILNRLKCAYVYPQIIEKMGIQGGILASDVEKALKEQPDVQAVLIVSPTYDGIVSDIRNIADVVHGHGIPLIVDEAHGAHFPFDDRMDEALSCGADLVIQSLHKTLPSLTQTAVLHGRRGYVDFEKLERYLQMFQTSSPSYVLMASIEQCIYEMAVHGREKMAEFSERIGEVRRELAEMKHLRLLEPGEKWLRLKEQSEGWLRLDEPGEKRLCLDEVSGVYDYDRSKIVVSCRNCLRVNEDGRRGRMDGNQLSDWLRTEYDLEMEMCGADYIVAITTYLDSQEGLGRLVEALKEIDGRLEACEVNQHPLNNWNLPDIRLKMADAMERRSEPLLLSDCAGKISAEFVYLYPPGIPIVAPGELVTERIVERVLQYKGMGLPVQGMADLNAERLRVLGEAADAEEG
ncbi:MAG: aminotransferase class I/II-fold pyridoxal phosphate-dependent enzyme [Eubacteriales bacterium]|nr:aminotransferase class I/II-fold pyridoxal phosphate-dependent enzyme [Eubacteriales bacterium]